MALTKYVSTLLHPGDNIVDIRASARGQPGLQDAKLGLSFSEGVVYDSNTAKRCVEELRKVHRLKIASISKMIPCKSRSTGRGNCLSCAIIVAK